MSEHGHTFSGLPFQRTCSFCFVLCFRTCRHIPSPSSQEDTSPSNFSSSVKDTISFSGPVVVHAIKFSILLVLTPFNVEGFTESPIC